MQRDDLGAMILDVGGAPDPDAREGRMWPSPLDLVAFAETEPEPPRFIVRDWLPCGYASLLAGHGGAGKSYIGIDLAIAIAAGTPWCGLPVERRRVLLLSCEDRASTLHFRLKRICAHHGLDLAGLAGQLDVLDLVGRDTILWRPDPNGRTPLTASYDELAAAMRETAAEVLIIDGATDTYGGSENDRSQVKAFVNALLGLIDPDAGAVLLLGHVNRLTASNGSTGEGYSGSTGWHNAVRARWYLRPEVEQGEDDETPRKSGRLALELQKSNLGRSDASLSFAWDDDAKMFVYHQLETGAVAAIREDAERHSILAALEAATSKTGYCPAATTGRRTAYHVLQATGLLAESLCSGKPGLRRFWRRIEELRATDKIREGCIRRANRHSTATLELETGGTEGMRQCAE